MPYSLLVPARVPPPPGSPAAAPAPLGPPLVAGTGDAGHSFGIRHLRRCLVVLVSRVVASQIFSVSQLWLFLAASSLDASAGKQRWRDTDDDRETSRLSENEQSPSRTAEDEAAPAANDVGLIIGKGFYDERSPRPYRRKCQGVLLKGGATLTKYTLYVLVSLFCVSSSSSFAIAVVVQWSNNEHEYKTPLLHSR